MSRASGLNSRVHQIDWLGFSIIVFAAAWVRGAAKAAECLVPGEMACTYQAALLETVAPFAAALCSVLFCSTAKRCLFPHRKYNRRALECRKASLPFLAATKAWLGDLLRVAKAWLPTLQLLLLTAVVAACKAIWWIIVIYWNFGARCPDQDCLAELPYADAEVPTGLAPIKVRPGSKDNLSSQHIATDLKQASVQASSSTTNSGEDPDTPPRLSEAAPGSASPFAADRSSLSAEDKPIAAAVAPSSNADSCSLVVADLEEQVRQLSVRCILQTALLHIVGEEKQQLVDKLQAAEAALSTLTTLHSNDNRNKTSSSSSSTTLPAAATAVAEAQSVPALPAAAAAAAVVKAAHVHPASTPLQAAEAALATLHSSSSTPAAAAPTAEANTATFAPPLPAAATAAKKPSSITTAAAAAAVANTASSATQRPPPVAAAVAKAVTFALPPPPPIPSSTLQGVAKSAAGHHQLDPVVSRDMVKVCSSSQQPVGSCSSVALETAIVTNKAPASEAALQLQGVFVGGLGNDATERLLYKLFARCGHVRAAWICRQRGSRASLGYGYVVFHGRDADQAVQRAVKLDGQLVQLQPICVKQTFRDFTAVLAAR